MRLLLFLRATRTRTRKGGRNAPFPFFNLLRRSAPKETLGLSKKWAALRDRGLVRRLTRSDTLYLRMKLLKRGPFVFFCVISFSS